MRLKRFFRRFLLFIFAATSLLVASPAWAHANLSRSDPAPNTASAEPPSVIRLWFTEPLESAFSQFRLRDTEGNLVPTGESQVDLSDPTLLYMVPGDLADGLYTVSWRVVSAVDGHQTIGSFPIAMGAAVDFGAGTIAAAESIPFDDAAVRWLNLMSMSLAVGSIAFLLFVWKPTAPEGNRAVERRIHILIWVGWIVVGVTGGLALLLQVSVAMDIPLIDAISSPALATTITATRYGNLWLTRTALWLGLALALVFARSDRWFYWVALAIGCGILLTNSLYSHAAASLDSTAAIAGDWFHFIASSIWIGGLIQFVNVIGPTRRAYDPPAPVVSTLVGHFSNFARVAVAGLIVTGLYAGWLQVGSIDGLISTLYGQTLLVKIILIVPLLGVAGINLLTTHRHLTAGNSAWIGRLHGLVGMEVALTATVLAAVGIMTSLAPSRGVLVVRGNVPLPPEPAPIVQERTANGLSARLEISPGWVGNNNFDITLTTADGSPITDASLIRLRFLSEGGGLGESELRPEATSDGFYRVAGDNLSLVGDWRIRVSIQRPNQFDTVIDFDPEVPLPPVPTPPPPIDPNPPLDSRVLALLLTGVAGVAAGGFFIGRLRLRLLNGAGLIAAALLATGLVFVASALLGMRPRPAAAHALQEQSPVRMVIRENLDLPYLITAGGQALRPIADGAWETLNIDATVRDIELEPGDQIVAAAEEGLFLMREGKWEQMEPTPTTRLESTHGYLFMMGSQLRRLLEGSQMTRDHLKHLQAPLETQDAQDFVMLGNHSHVLQNGGQVFLTPDLGLTWLPLEAPAPVSHITTDAAGQLMISTEQGIYVYEGGRWRSLAALPEGLSIDVMQTFDGRLYAAAGSRLFRHNGSAWEAVALPNSAGSHIVALAVQYPDTLWVLDAATPQLWSTADAATWTTIPITIATGVTQG